MTIAHRRALLGAAAASPALALAAPALAQTAPETGALKVPPGSGLHGSVYFMAPEQFEGTAVDARTDLYALGCVFYYALTQHYPFGGETKPQVMVAHLHHRPPPQAALRPDLPAPTVQWVEWLISRSPTNRPTSADEALRAYETGTAGSCEGILSHPQRRHDRAQEESRGYA